MVLPSSEVKRLEGIARRYAAQGFFTLPGDPRYIVQVARTDPTALDGMVSMMTDYFNRGIIPIIGIENTLNLLGDLAIVSEYLRAKIAEAISQEVLDFHASDYSEPDVAKAVQRLSDTLKIERPKHYFDLCRRILASNGSIFIIGAGFSYDSYAPLLREMEGIACSTLDDLGIENPRKLYKTDEEKAWEIISGGWRRFQRHVSFTLLPKEPSDQHFILAELFHKGNVTHIISLNWDDLVEKAYINLYNVSIPVITQEGPTSEHALWKLHGDIGNPDERWVLPFEDGRVFTPIEEIVQQTMIPAFSIGYREQEKQIRECIISIFEKRGGMTRIRPDLEDKPPETFKDNALMAMKKIKASLESAKKATYPE